MKVIPDEFAGKVAVVTGGTRGIGLGAVRRLAMGGAAVVFCGLEEEEGKWQEAAMREEQLNVRYRKADVRSAREVEAFIAYAVQEFGGVDILVNSAGIQRYGDVVETDEALWDDVLAVNLKGMFLTAKYAIPEMRKRGGGSIVNVSSTQAFASQTRVAAYTASKGAINALTRAMALDHAGEGIRVNAVCPASVDTPMLHWAADLFKGEQTKEQVLEAWGRMHPIGRVGTVEEVADLIAYLSSDRAGFITGGEYKIDGGLLARLGVVLPD